MSQSTSDNHTPRDTLTNVSQLELEQEQESHDIECLGATGRTVQVKQPPTVDGNIKSWKTYPPLSFPVVALLIPASILGTLARLGLVAMTSYDGESIFPLAYPQAVGCLVMGFGLGLKEPLNRFYPPLYTALTSGFCGSLTTFSGWQLDVFSSWINAGGYQRSGFQNFIDGVGKSVFTLSLSVASISFGSNVANLLAPHLPSPRFPSRPVRYAWSAMAVCMYAAVFPAYFKASPRFRHQATASLLFAYPGALSRYLSSIYLNHRTQALPFGTLVANLTGTTLLGVFHVLQSLQNPASPDACSLLQGLEDGYCGCLTTISTFAAELRDLEWWKGVRYGIISWVVGQLLLLVIVGSAIWAGHAGKEITCRFA